MQHHLGICVIFTKLKNLTSSVSKHISMNDIEDKLQYFYAHSTVQSIFHILNILYVNCKPTANRLCHNCPNHQVYQFQVTKKLMWQFKTEYTFMQLHSECFEFLELCSGVLHLIQINSTNNLGKYVTFSTISFTFCCQCDFWIHWAIIT
jgi:hypothetical protein